MLVVQNSKVLLLQPANRSAGFVPNLHIEDDEPVCTTRRNFFLNGREGV